MYLANLQFVVKRLLREFAGAQFQTGVAVVLDQLTQTMVCRTCVYYRKKVDSMVVSLEEAFSIIITWSSSRHKTGGFRKSVRSYEATNKPLLILAAWTIQCPSSHQTKAVIVVGGLNVAFDL